MAIPSANRLKKEDFDLVFKKGKTVSGSFLFLKYATNEGQVTKMSIVVPAKVSKKASQRNRIKRIVSESLKPMLGQLDNGLMMVIVVTHLPENNISKLLRNDCEAVIKKSNILK